MGKKILIIEDNESIRSVLRMALQLGNYEIVEAADGREGLQCLKENPDCVLVISDLAMPVMDGYEVLRQIRAELGRGDLPVFILSAEKDASQAMDLGATRVIRKPFSPIELLESVRRALEPKT